MTSPTFTAAQRRQRLVARHHLARTGTDPVQVTRDLVALHASDPATPVLSLWARLPGYQVGASDSALYEDRTLWRLHAMRRTLWIVRTGDAPDVMAAASAAVARTERARLHKVIAAAMPDVDPPAWLESAAAEVRTLMADGEARSTAELGEALPVLRTPLTMGSGRWVTQTALSSRLLFLMAMEGEVVRGPSVTWRSSQYRWTARDSWFPEPPPPGPPVEQARIALMRRLLERFGPATGTDLKWWTGWTVRQTAAALAGVQAQEVGTEHGPAWILPGDDADEPPAEADPVVSFLPSLDPSTMGWKDRAFYLDPAHVPLLFDTNGNAGPTVWLDGRVVGGWGQRPDGRVVTDLLTDVGRDAADLVASEGQRLTAWLDGTVITARFPSPLSRRLMA